MSPKFPDENEMEEETIHKKRARRVSFAETTAVHFFNRDDESESTPDDASKEELNSSIGKLSRTESEEILDLLQSSSSSDDDSDGDDDAVIKSAFLRPMESPSSGSCFGSATSNDEDNFFGPVSSEFIRPGRLSDSAISDENHEVTMDSTAFSMNFRSLARSDSGGEFKTPTGVRIPFGLRTPGGTSTEASLGDLMVLTGSGNRISRSSLPVSKVNDSGDSDDMSLVGTHHHNYDYGQLPPELDVLLAEGDENVKPMSLIGDVECSNSRRATTPKCNQDLSRCDNFDQTDSRDAGPVHKIDSSEISAEALSVDLLNVEKGNDDTSDTTLGETTQHHSNQVDDGPGSITPINDHDQATSLQINDISLEKDSNVRTGSSPGSISSLLSKRRQIFKDPCSLENALLNSPQDDKVFRVRGTLNRGWSTSVFAKSVSRLKRLETSFLSASKFEGKASRLRVHGLSPRCLERDNNVEYVSKDISFTCFDAPVACLDVRFAESDGQFKKDSDRDNYDLKDTEILQSESCIEVDKDEIFSGLHKSSPSPKTSAKHPVSSSTASLEIGSLDCKTKDRHESELETPAIKTVQSIQNDSSLLDITVNGSKDSINSVMFGNINCSPASEVVNKVSASPLYGGSPFMFNLDHQGQKEGDDLASIVENYSSLLSEKKNKSKLSACDIDHQFSKPAEPHLMDKILKSHNVISSNYNVETGSKLTSFTMDLPVQGLQSLPGCTLSSDARSHELPIQVLDNSTEVEVCSTTLNVTCGLRDNAEVKSSEGQCDAPLDKRISTYNEDAQVSLESFDICVSDAPLSHKRKLSDEIEDHDLLPRKPKLYKDQKNYEEDHMGSHYVKTDLASRDWADVFTSFCGVTKQLLVPISDKLNVALIEQLDDILIRLDKLKSYELLHHEKSLDPAHFLRSKRVGDAKLLLYKTVYQKAKLQLIRLKRAKLLDQASRMKSRVDESEKIMSSCDLISKQGETGQIGCLQLERQCTDTGSRNLVSAELCSLRKEFEDSEGGIRKLNKSFYTYIKDMEESTSTETAAYVKSFLKKRVACQSLQSEMQFCKVERLEAIHGQPNIMFDHGGFLLQSFITKSTSTSGLFVTNGLNKEKIFKMFINDMDAHTAFSSVLSGDVQLTYEGLRTIAEQTQKTVSRLHILLDVMEEVQLAMMELRSLTWSRFCQPSAGKLDLQLCFTDFRSGERVTLSFDITCLKWGVYPSQILPYEVQGITARSQDIFESLVEDIRTSVQGVSSGFMRIISICRCVSRMIETGGMSKVGDTH